jgi:hypothetical protein
VTSGGIWKNPFRRNISEKYSATSWKTVESEHRELLSNKKEFFLPF